MAVDRKWVEGTIGFDPITTLSPVSVCSAIVCRVLIAAES